MNMNMLTAYYIISTDILKEHLPTIPELKLTNAKGYYGKIHRENGKVKYIALSKYNLDCGRIDWWEDEDIDDLINTICHELAHMLFWDHSTEHTETTKAMFDMVKSELEIRRLNKQLENLS